MAVDLSVERAVRDIERRRNPRRVGRVADIQEHETLVPVGQVRIGAIRADRDVVQEPVRRGAEARVVVGVAV